MGDDRTLTFIFIFFIPILTGCTPSLSRGKTPEFPDLKMGYIAGSFKHSYRESHLQMGLKITNLSKKRFNRITLKLQPTEQYKAIDLYAVEPGVYKLLSLNILSKIGSEFDQHNILPPYMQKTINIQAGKIYYLGNFEGKTSGNYWKFKIRASNPYAMGPYSCDIKFSKSSLDEVGNTIVSFYPNYSSLPLINAYEDEE